MVGLITGVAVVLDLAAKEPGAVAPLPMFLDFVTAAIMDGLILGSLVNLLVALVPVPEASFQLALGQDAAQPAPVDVPARPTDQRWVCPECGEIAMTSVEKTTYRTVSDVLSPEPQQ